MLEIKQVPCKWVPESHGGEEESLGEGVLGRQPWVQGVQPGLGSNAASQPWPQEIEWTPGVPAVPEVQPDVRIQAQPLRTYTWGKKGEGSLGQQSPPPPASSLGQLTIPGGGRLMETFHKQRCSFAQTPKNLHEKQNSKFILVPRTWEAMPSLLIIHMVHELFKEP